MLLPVLLVMAAAAVGVFMPYRRVVVAWFGDFLDWEDEHGGRRLGVNYPSPKHIGAATSLILAFWGGSAVLGGGGGSGTPTTPPPSYSAPNTPTVDVAVFSAGADSARLIGSVFVGSLDDTHDSTQFDVDTVSGDWSTPVFSSDLGALETDTVPGLDSAAVYKARVRYRGTNGGWSAWSDSAQFSTTISVGSAVEQFYSSWETALGQTSNALNDGGAFDPDTALIPGNLALEVVDTAGLSYPGPGSNLFRIEVDGAMYGNIQTFPEVPRGETMFIRFLIRFDAGGDVNAGSHFFVHDIYQYRNGYLSPISSGYSTGYWGLKFQHDSPQPGSWSATDAYPFYGWYMVDGILQQGVWYEVVYEMRVVADAENDAAPIGTGQGAWASSTEYEMQPYISVYTMAGALVADNDDFRCVDYGASGIGLAPYGDQWDLGQWISEGRTFTSGNNTATSYVDALANARSFSLGNNSQAGQSAGSGSDYIYVGDFGIYTGAAPALIGS